MSIVTASRNFMIVALTGWVFTAIADESSMNLNRKSYSPYIDQNYPTNVYWGDTHLHTNMSLDANGLGNKALTPDDAYRFAKGEAVLAHNGQYVRLRLPLDFLVVADHAENMGVMPRLQARDPALLKTTVGKHWYRAMQEWPLSTGEVVNGKLGPYKDVMRSVLDNKHGERSFFWSGFFTGDIGLGYLGAGRVGDETFRRFVWVDVVSKADHHNEPGKFTAFSGYEWSAASYVDQYTESDGHYHRVVIFKDDANKVTQTLPFSQFDSRDPEKLWQNLAAYEKKTGGEVIAIPHNSNLSNGQSFSLLGYKGQPLNTAYAKIRSRWEPLVEVTQIKGDSETHPVLSPTDEFADYANEYADYRSRGRRSEARKSRKQAEYARSALKLGLGQHAKLGVNPFKFGMIGSTDAHTSLATADQDNFWGKLSLLEPGQYRMRHAMSPYNWRWNAAGYAAVWAEENTRDALFAAMKRKESYATTGPRMTVRFFGGWDYETDDALRPNLAAIGYSKGVPMGGDLANAPKEKPPSFLIHAVKDPDGANLDRVQVIKGWHNKNGELHETIYNVALSDGRKENRKGKVKAVGNTVDIKNAFYTNSIGDPELAVVWQDPDFDKNELAFYYVRVLEIPTPRWTAYDAKFFGLIDIPQEVPMVTQERAYTSPIWYSPK